MTKRNQTNNPNKEAEIIELERQLKAAEAELSELKQRTDMCASFELVARNTSHSVAIVDINGLTLWVNPSFEKLSGLSSEEIVGKPAGRFLQGPGTDLSTIQNIWKQMQLQQSFTYELQHYAKDGKPYQIIVNGEPILNPDGTLFGYAMIETDITLLKIMEQALADAHHSAEEKENAKINFLSNLSHELRTPLNGILGMTELLAISDPTEEQVEYIQTIQQSAESLTELINNLLDLTGKTMNKSALSFEPVDLKKKVESIASRYKAESIKKEIRLCVTVDPAMPEKIILPWVDVAKVLAHLCDNAVKFTETGRVGINVYPKDAEFLVCEVHDTGIGIQADVLPHIFVEYFQGDESHTRSYEGIGLGLTLAKKFACRFGSHIDVQTDIGTGSCFSFLIPIQPA